MFREYSGNMEVNVTHDLSRRMRTKRFSRFENLENYQYISSKIEIRQNNVKEVQ